MTPSQTPGLMGRTPGSTPVRDKLSINPEECLDVDVRNRENKASLRLGLNSLPAPRNDFEIVVPETEEEETMADQGEVWIEDQADIDQQTEEEFREAEFKLRSQSVQRDLPRPIDMNHTTLRPISSDLTDLQKAEELIKREMIVMLHYDCLETPTAAQMGEGSRKKRDDKERQIVNEQHHRHYLDKHPYVKFNDEDISEAKDLLSQEMEVVRNGMNHGELSLEAYTQVWEECLSQVLYLPSQNRYTRANLANKKDRIESLEKRLEQNRSHMKKDSKKAVKIEDRLKILTRGYQTRSQGLIKQIGDLEDQIEQTHLELSTFSFLKDQETKAIPRRLQSIQDDVEKQKEREADLQERYRTAALFLESNK